MGYEKVKNGFEHPLINFELPQALFRTNKITLKFTKKLSSPLR